MTFDELEKQYQENEKELNKLYEQIVCEYDFVRSLKNLNQETKSELKSLNADVSFMNDLKDIE